MYTASKKIIKIQTSVDDMLPTSTSKFIALGEVIQIHQDGN